MRQHRVRHDDRRLHGRPLRHSAVLLTLSLVLAAAATGAALAAPFSTATPSADDVTASVNNLRTGWDPGEPGLAPVSDGGPVGGPEFGQLFSTHLNGRIFAQPLV